MEWLPPQESVVAATAPTINLDDQPTRSPMSTKPGYVEVDELPQSWDYEFELGLGHLSSHSPTSHLALMRQRRRQQYRRKGPSCTAEPRMPRQRRADRRPSPMPLVPSQSLQRPPPSRMHSDAGPAHQPEHQQQQNPDGMEPSIQTARSTCASLDLLGSTLAHDHAVPGNTVACDPVNGTGDVDVDMSCPDRQPWTANNKPTVVEGTIDSSGLAGPVTRPQPHTRPSTLRSEAIRAALALEALKLDTENSSSAGDKPEADEPGTTVTPGTTNPDPVSENDMLEGLPIRREYGLLRVRPASHLAAPAAPATNRVLVHSVPRVRKRRLKKLETRLGATDSAPSTPVGTDADQRGH